jgi:hypothetical protein
MLGDTAQCNEYVRLLGQSKLRIKMNEALPQDVYLTAEIVQIGLMHVMLLPGKHNSTLILFVYSYALSEVYFRQTARVEEFWYSMGIRLAC